MKEWIPGELQFNYYLHYLLLLQGFPQFLIDYAFVISVHLCIYYLLAFVLYLSTGYHKDLTFKILYKNSLLKNKGDCQCFTSFIFFNYFIYELADFGAVHKWRLQLGGGEGSKIAQNCWRTILKTSCRYGGGGLSKSRKITFMDDPSKASFPELNK